MARLHALLFRSFVSAAREPATAAWRRATEVFVAQCASAVAAASPDPQFRSLPSRGWRRGSGAVMTDLAGPRS